MYQYLSKLNISEYKTLIPDIELIDLQIYFGFILFEVLLLVVVPGKKYNGPYTDKAFTPTYYDNGL